MVGLLPINVENREWYTAFRAGADALGVDSVELHVRPQNTRAIRCYRKCGFEETGSFVKQNGVAVVQMKKQL